MNKPEKELKAFTKTKELRPGETVTATLKLNTTDLAFMMKLLLHG